MHSNSIMQLYLLAGAASGAAAAVLYGDPVSVQLGVPIEPTEAFL